MKNTYKKPVKTNNVPTKKDKIKGLQVWTFILIILVGFAHSQYQMIFMLPAEAQTTSVTPDDRLGEVLDPKGTIYIKEGTDPAWGKIKEPKVIKARVTYYSVADSCHFPSKDGGCYSANYPHKITKGDMACPKEYKFGTKVEYNGTIYTCNDRTANWVQDKWAEPTFDIFVPTSKEVKGVKYTTVTIK